MRWPTVVVLTALSLALLASTFAMISCAEEDTPMFTDEEKVSAAKAMVDKYVAAWDAKSVEDIIKYYAGYATILVPTVGTLNPDRYADYLTQLLGPMEVVGYLATDREVHLVEAETANVKFRAWVLMQTDLGEYYASQTWITWRLHWTANDVWRIAVENGTDKIAVKDQLLTVLSIWIAGWETKTIPDILSVYAPDATIVEPDGTEYDLAGYSDVLTAGFADIDQIDLEYLLFHIDEFTWDEATVSFQLASTITRPGGAIDYRTDTVTWRLVPSDDTWLVQSQQTENVTATDDDTTDDDTTVDDDDADDDTTDDDAADDDTADDDTADDDTVDDDTV